MLGLLVALVSVAAVAGPVSAQEAKILDGKRDVWVSEDGGQARHYGGRTTNSDLVAAVVSHGHRRITLESRYVALSASTTDRLRLYLKLRIDTEAEFYVGAFVHGKHSRVFVFDEAQQQLHCSKASVTVRRKKGRISVSVPRTCVGEPTYFGWQAYSVMTRTTKAHERTFLDDAASDGSTPSGYRPSLKRR